MVFCLSGYIFSPFSSIFSAAQRPTRCFLVAMELKPSSIFPYSLAVWVWHIAERQLWAWIPFPLQAWRDHQKSRCCWCLWVQLMQCFPRPGFHYLELNWFFCFNEALEKSDRFDPWNSFLAQFFLTPSYFRKKVPPFLNRKDFLPLPHFRLVGNNFGHSPTFWSRSAVRFFYR